jgi:hypothetical protein
MRRHRRKLGLWLAASLWAGIIVPTAMPASAVEIPDQVLAWNKNAYQELVVVAGQAPPVAALNLAMVHGAVYDAVNAIDGGFEPYLGAPQAADTYSKDAAAAAAAYQVLLSVLPGRATQLTAYYAASLALIPDGPDENGGVEVGEAAAGAMIQARQDDGRPGTPSFTSTAFTEGLGAGEWRALAVGLPGNNFKWVGDVDPFLVPDAAMFASNGPLPLASADYAAEFEQVKSLGAVTSSTRTSDQTEQARFWADHAVAMWTRIVEQLAESQDLTNVQSARLFGMLYLTGADAIIACLQDKERWGFWRPQTAIRNADDDGNPATVADPTWTSLLPNPPYPDQPSGHNCFSSSVVETLKDFFGTNQMAFDATHSSLGIKREFTRFSQAIVEIRLARVYGGIHFMTADASGAGLGRKVAKYRAENYFAPAA